MIATGLASMAASGCAGTGAVTGTVLHESGAPCDGCSIGLTPVTPGISVSELTRYTGSDGTFRVEGLEPGDYVVSAFHDASSADEAVTVVRRQTTVVAMTVR